MAHTLKVIAAGFGLLGLCLLMGAWLSTPTSTAGLAAAAKVFIPLWLVGAGINMWVGVRRGYGFAEEVPYFLLVFAVPAAVAIFLAWRFSRG